MKIHPTWKLSIKHGPLCVKIRVVAFWGIFFILPSQKKTFQPPGKLKMVLLFIKVVNSHRKHCLPCTYAPIYRIWAHYHKLRCRDGHDFGHLAWNTSMFVHGRPYREACFSKVVKTHVYHFSWQLVHVSERHAQVLHFFIFLYFLWYFSKLGQICLHANSL